MNDNQDSRTGGGLLLGVGAALLMVLCCAGPVLITAGVLTVVGGFLPNPWVIGAGLTLIAIVILGLVRRRTRDQADDCCVPSSRATDTTDDTKDEIHP